MYDFAEETSLPTLEECFPLCKDHFEEVGMGGEFNVDWSILKSFLDAGVLCIVVARKDLQIVGYWMNVLTKDFMTSELIAKELSIYISPSHRGGRLFLKMSEFNTELLKTKGVVTQYITFMDGHNEKMPLRMGFEPVEVTYKKVIGER